MVKHFLQRTQFNLLYQALVDEGYQVIGPISQQGTIVFDDIESFDQLPWGLREEVEAGSYTLTESEPERCFRWNTGPQSMKPWLFKPTQMLWRGTESADGITFKPEEPKANPKAFVGMRSCDIAALYLQDKHFMYGPSPDPWYVNQREQLCVVAVNCSQSAQTCFCTSTGDGPEAMYGFDLALDELDDGYLLLAKSEKGDRILQRLPLISATEQQHKLAQKQIKQASKQQKKMPDEHRLRKLIDHLDDSQWLSIAERCLACGNCTSVCPTCFCSKQESHTDIETGDYQQVRYWDSCFSEQHGYISGKHIRSQISQRYRQWVLHKLATWQDQYQRSGCVGCGRCIAWCPAAIDLVDEVNAMLKRSNNA